MKMRKVSPLISLQIRLRNLIKITGINLELIDSKSSVFFTLHLSAFSKPFYTSSIVEIRNNKADWPEISIREHWKSSHRFICVRVWQTNRKKIGNDNCNNNELLLADNKNKMLFLWGIYFSGLVSISESFQFKRNTLLFHFNGENTNDRFCVFTSNDQINYQHQTNKSQFNDNSNTNNDNIIPIEEANYENIQKYCDKDYKNRDRYSNFNNFSLINGNNNNNNNHAEKTPPSLVSPKHENQDSNDQSVNVVLNESVYHRVRYVHLNFPKNEIQQSYTLDILLQMQEIQRETYERNKKSKILADRICMKSPACLDSDLVKTKPIFYEPQKKQAGMGKTLTRLLTQDPVRPEILLQAHELRIKIERMRFRIKLLSQERDRSRIFNKQLKARREKLKDDNTEMETLIWNSLRTLNRENLRTYEEKLCLQREVFLNVKLALLETKRFLLKELNEIYIVKKHDRFFFINGIHLPDAESYGESQSAPVEISIALGYVAHAVLIISRILNVPLRNQIIHEGSRSKIMDAIKILAPSDRIFPLFCRVMPPPNMLLYGVYLLNQNISQLKFMLGMSRGDLRASLANLNSILMNEISSDLYSTMRFTEDSKPIANSASSISDSINVPIAISPLNRRKSRSLEDFEDNFNDFSENINSSAPDLTKIDEQLE